MLKRIIELRYKNLAHQQSDFLELGFSAPIFVLVGVLTYIITLEHNLYDILKSKLVPYGFPYETASLFSDLSDKMQNELRLTISKFNIGEALLFYSQTNSGWVIIATTAIAINKDEEIKILKLDNIKSINSDVNERHFKKNLHEKYKFELSNWIIKDKFEKEYLISIDKGKIYYSFYHALIKILRIKGYLKSN